MNLEVYDEINRMAYEGWKQPCAYPVEEISKHKNEKGWRRRYPSLFGGSCQGITEMWARLCEPWCVVKTKIPFPNDCPHFRKTPRATEHSGTLNLFPELGKEPVTDEQWELMKNARTLLPWKILIPSNMMKGIENVAHTLMKDMQSGKMSLDSLNMEELGQSVASRSDRCVFVCKQFGSNHPGAFKDAKFCTLRDAFFFTFFFILRVACHLPCLVFVSSLGTIVPFPCFGWPRP